MHSSLLRVATIALGILCQVRVLAAEPKPNFILINIDDLGYADIGPFGGKHPTPHLDRMAREGRKLTSHYAAPLCTPSRAALMTGCYPKRVLPIRHVLFPGGAVGLSPDEKTIAEVLHDAGYATACVGKWHLGDQPEFLPTRQGFDYYYGLPYSNDMGPAADGVKSNLGRTPQPETKKTSPPPPPAPPRAVDGDETGIKNADQPPLPLLENETVIARVRQVEQAELTRRYTEKAVAFVRQQAARPFFLYLAHTAVHFPLYPGKSFAGQSGHGLIADWIAEVDWSVGQVLNLVRELKLDGKTLVIFTSDNGGVIGNGSSNGALRGQKAQVWEGGMRVPTIAWWPGQIPANTSTDAITSMMDVLPTFAGLAGAHVPLNRKIDGIDQWPVLAGTAGAKPPRDHFYFFYGPRLLGVRSGPWKFRVDRKELYHLGDDIGETTDVAAAHPEVVQRLQMLAQAMNADLGIEEIGPGCRPIGRVPNPQPLIARDGTVRSGFAGAQKRFP